MRLGTLRIGLITAGLFVSGLALAQEPMVPPTPAGGAAPPAVNATPTADGSGSRLRVGLNLVPMPFGKMTASFAGTSFSGDAAMAFGIMPFIDYMLTPNLFIGFTPTYTLNVKASDGGGDAAKELDLMLRLGGQAPIGDALQLYGYLAPGYSIIMPSSGDSAKGLALGIHAGAMYSLSSTLFLNGELGYQIGFQKLSVGGATADFKVSYMQIALGGGIRL